MNREPLPPHLRALVAAERDRPDAPAEEKAAAQGRLAALLGVGGGLGDGGAGDGGAGGGGADADRSPGKRPGAGGGGSAADGSPGKRPGAGAAAGRGLGAKLLAAFLVGGLVGGGIVASALQPREPRERIVYVDRGAVANGGPGAATTEPTATAVTTAVSALPTASAANAPAASAANAPAAGGSSSTSRGGAAGAITSGSGGAGRARDTDLAAERAILERARSALARGDGQGALAAVAQHEREFGKGQLVEEREVVAVQALVTSGRVQEAAERGARFRKAFPNSLLLPVVDQVLR